MKKILFDLTATQPFGNNTRHGGGKYGEMVLLRMLQMKCNIVCYFDSKRWLNPKIKDDLLKNDVELFDINLCSIQDLVSRTKCDLVYSALPQRALFKLKNCNVYCTIHGLRRLELQTDPYFLLYKGQSWKSWIAYFAQLLSPKLYRKAMCKYKLSEWCNSNIHLITVSNHSASSIKYFFPKLKDKTIPVFYSPSTSFGQIHERKYSDNFFLLVSGNRVEKNNLRAIRALDNLFSSGYLIGYKVKIVGANNEQIFRYKIKNKENFEFLGYVEDCKLEQLYHDAYALIYPSLNEGFGYPPLEAMQYGTPVLASPFTSITEICAGAALYSNPLSISEIATRIIYILDKNVRKKYSELSVERYLKISKKQEEDLNALVRYLYK